VTTATSNDEASQVALFSVSPNPSNDHITIFCEQELEMILLDAQGVEMLRQKLNGTEGEISLSNLPPGLYMLRGTDAANRHQVIRVIKN
jgi:saccharopine dehydrogenase-like NADP-dependent oxidoreductase